VVTSGGTNYSCSSRFCLDFSRAKLTDGRLVPGAPFRYRTGHAKTCRFCAFSGDERSQENAFRPRDPQFFLIDFDALGERAKMIAAVAPVLGPRALAGCPGKRLESLRRDAQILARCGQTSNAH
jgi:hypothetical protein